MEIIISGRKVPVSEDLRAYIQAKVGRIEHEYPKLTTARVVLDMERGQYIAEMSLRGKHLDLEVQTRAHDMYAAIDDAADKLEHRLRKHIERIQDHRRRAASGVLESSAPEQAGADEEEIPEFEEEEAGAAEESSG